VLALAQAARATCRLCKGAAIRRWCFLTKIFRDGPFCHFIGAGGLICQKFQVRSSLCMLLVPIRDVWYVSLARNRIMVVPIRDILYVFLPTIINGVTDSRC
jgi:hypothetical protein